MIYLKILLHIAYLTCSHFFVQQAGEKHYHPTCARCARCEQMFGEGEEMYLQGEGSFQTLVQYFCFHLSLLFPSYFFYKQQITIATNARNGVSAGWMNLYRCVPGSHWHRSYLAATDLPLAAACLFRSIESSPVAWAEL